MQLKAQGVDVVDFGAGEPDFPTPQHIGDAAKAAIDANFTKYTTNSGTEELKRAVVRPLPHRLRRRVQDQRGDHLRRRQAGALQRGDVPLRAGRRSHHAHARLADAGRADQARRSHAGHRADACRRTGSALRADTIIAAITPRTRGIVINSPGNPTGALMDETEMAALADAVAPRGIWIVLDLCYEKLIYDPVAHNLPRVLVERMRDRTVLCGSASKAYAMTGWRCGLALAPAALIARVQRPAEPLDLERLLDHAEGGRRGAERSAGVRHRDARRVPASGAISCASGWRRSRASGS